MYFSNCAAPPEPIMNLSNNFAIHVHLIVFVVYVFFVVYFKDTHNKVYFSVPQLQPDPHQAWPEGGAPGYLAL